jgi:hypothetical protein
VFLVAREVLVVLGMKPMNENGNQGEGNRTAARHYNDAASEFAENDQKVEQAARDAASYVEAEPEDAKRAESQAKRGPKGTRVSVDELVEMGRSVMDRVKPYVDRVIARVKSKLDR